MKLLIAIAFFAIAFPVFTAEKLPVPGFPDPARRAKLEKAFPEIEKIFERYQQQRQRFRNEDF